MKKVHNWEERGQAGNFPVSSPQSQHKAQVDFALTKHHKLEGVTHRAHAEFSAGYPF